MFFIFYKNSRVSIRVVKGILTLFVGASSEVFSLLASLIIDIYIVDSKYESSCWDLIWLKTQNDLKLVMEISKITEEGFWTP